MTYLPLTIDHSFAHFLANFFWLKSRYCKLKKWPDQYFLFWIRTSSLVVSVWLVCVRQIDESKLKLDCFTNIYNLLASLHFFRQLHPLFTWPKNCKNRKLQCSLQHFLFLLAFSCPVSSSLSKCPPNPLTGYSTATTVRPTHNGATARFGNLVSVDLVDVG